MKSSLGAAVGCEADLARSNSAVPACAPAGPVEIIADAATIANAATPPAIRRRRRPALSVRMPTPVLHSPTFEAVHPAGNPITSGRPRRYERMR